MRPQKTILWIAPSRMEIRSFIESLEENNCTVVHFSAPSEAAAWIQEGHAPNLVLCDTQLPRRDQQVFGGSDSKPVYFSFAKWMRSQPTTTEIPCLLFCSTSSKEIDNRFYELHSSYHLGKLDVDLSSFWRAVDALLSTQHSR